VREEYRVGPNFKRTFFRTAFATRSDAEKANLFFGSASPISIARNTPALHTESRSVYNPGWNHKFLFLRRTSRET